MKVLFFFLIFIMTELIQSKGLLDNLIDKNFTK